MRKHAINAGLGLVLILAVFLIGATPLHYRTGFDLLKMVADTVEVTDAITLSGDLDAGNVDADYGIINDSLNLAGYMVSNLTPLTTGAFNLGTGAKSWGFAYIDSVGTIYIVSSDSVYAEHGVFNTNIVATAAACDWLPSTTGAYDLGSAASSWGYAYVDSALVVLNIDADSTNSDHVIVNTQLDANGTFVTSADNIADSSIAYGVDCSTFVDGSFVNVDEDSSRIDGFGFALYGEDETVSGKWTHSDSLTFSGSYAVFTDGATDINWIYNDGSFLGFGGTNPVIFGVDVVDSGNHDVYGNLDVTDTIYSGVFGAIGTDSTYFTQTGDGGVFNVTHDATSYNPLTIYYNRLVTGEIFVTAGNSYYGVDASLADSSWRYDDGDTVRYGSDNPASFESGGERIWDVWTSGVTGAQMLHVPELWTNDLYLLGSTQFADSIFVIDTLAAISSHLDGKQDAADLLTQLVSCTDSATCATDTLFLWKGGKVAIIEFATP